METETDQNLKALEQLVEEFFAVGTSNDRKREIEELLSRFSSQQDSWIYCLQFLIRTENHYVLMYCLNIFENVINRMWIGVNPENKLKIRSSLSKYLLSSYSKSPAFIRNKVVKVLVDIGRHDWPHYYPDFFSNIYQLFQHKETISLGIIMLQITSEEFAFPREDLSIARRQELHKLLCQEIPKILELLTNTLHLVIEKNTRDISKTPASSPTRSSDLVHNNRSVPFNSSNTFSSIPFSSDEDKDITIIDHLVGLDSESRKISTLVLKCFSHLFSWIPLTEHISPSLVKTIFQFVILGCHTVTSDLNEDIAKKNLLSDNDNSSLGTLAMSCINEIFSKNCVPLQFEDFLLHLFKQTFHLLLLITCNNSLNNSDGNNLENLDESFLEKLTEFLRLFVGIHLRRYENNPLFPVTDFLRLLLKYTAEQPTNEGLFACFEIWSLFLDSVKNQTQSHLTGKQAPKIVLAKYKDILLSLANQLLQKFQFRINQNQIEEMDNDSLNDDFQTEWQQYLDECIELIAKIAEFFPNDVLKLLISSLNECLHVYRSLEKYFSNNAKGKILNIVGEKECHQLHCTLKDLCSNLQAVGRLSEFFIGEKFSSRFNEAANLLEKVYESLSYGEKLKLYKQHDSLSNILQQDFVEVHAQLLATLQAYNQWMTQFHVESQRHGQQQEQFISLISGMIDSTIGLFKEEVPKKIMLVAAHLLVSTATSIRPTFLIQLPAVQKLFNDFSEASFPFLPTQVSILLSQGLSNILILPWPNIPDSEQQWQARSSNHSSFVRRLTEEYRKLDKSSLRGIQQDQAKAVIKNTLGILIHLTMNVGSEVTKTKQILFFSIQDSINFSLSLLPIYIHDPEIAEDLLMFLTAVVDSLGVQMGKPLTEHIIQTVMNLFTSDQLKETIYHENSAGFRVIQKFINILEMVVEEPSREFKGFLNNIVDLCMQQIFPLIINLTLPDLKISFFQLLYKILLLNWNYFFHSSLLNSFNTKGEATENQGQFILIMQAFGQSFTQPEISIFKQNLVALESINSKWKLYSKKLFKDMMLSHFLIIFLQNLLNKSHELLHEEIVVLLYNMASIDFEYFYSQLVTQFIDNSESIDSHQKSLLKNNIRLVKDIPSFIQVIDGFLNDFNYYKMCNIGLPHGSVQLSTSV